MSMKSTLRGIRAAMLAVSAGALLPIDSAAATAIEIDSVIQRWPWNNKVDITYTIEGGQDVSSAEYKKIVFTAVIGGATYTIDGTAVGASAAAGQHTVMWFAPSGLQNDNCTMSAAVYPDTVPSGNDYMIIDLATGDVAYEGLFATQEESNARYNTAVYKTDKLVLRKVPAGGTYPTGHALNNSTGNTPRTWTTNRDYYIGVFPVTQGQYTKLGLENKSTNTKDIAGNTTAHRPVERVSWNDLRLEGTAPTSPIPTVDSAGEGTFFQRLDFITGNRFGFDLPTEVMFEIAERAGATTKYYWGDDDDERYVVYNRVKRDGPTEVGNDGASTVAVGSRLPNSWGLYDTAGNVWEWCLDDNSLADLANAADPFTPAWNSKDHRRWRGGGGYGNEWFNHHLASMRLSQLPLAANADLGFRVALIVR